MSRFSRMDSRGTSRVLVAGSTLSSLLFLAAVIFQSFVGARSGIPDVAPLDPSAWAAAGILVLLGTPMVGLLATMSECRSRDRQTALLAAGVLALLGLSVILSLFR